MVAVNEIKSFCKRIAAEYRPTSIVLFGSYASGRARPDSDVDLLVVMPFKGSGVSKAAEIIRKLSPHFAVDLVIRTPSDIKRRIAMNDFFLKEASQGKLLYEAPDSRRPITCSDCLISPYVWSPHGRRSALSSACSTSLPWHFVILANLPKNRTPPKP